MAQVEVSAGVVEVQDSGGDGPVVVLMGGLAIGPSLWDGVVTELAPAHRVVVPTMPWGAHRIAMKPDADLSLAGHARTVAEVLERMDLRDVTLVENDSGMAQLVAADHAERLAALVLVSCETAGNYPPGLPGKLIGLLGRLPGGVFAAFSPLRVRPLRRQPITFGWMTAGRVPDAVMDAWFAPLQSDRAIRRDLTKYLRSVDRRSFDAVLPRLAAFDRPAVVAWGAEDKVMPRATGERLAAALPRGRFVLVPGARTLVPLDQPAALAAIIRAVVPARSGASGS